MWSIKIKRASLSFVTIMLLVSASSMAYAKNNRDAMTDVPAIDGEIDDTWVNAKSYPIDKLNGKPADGTIRPSSFKFMKDSENLYFLVDVQDGRLLASDKLPHNQDCVEFLTGVSSSYTGTTHRVNPWNEITSERPINGYTNQYYNEEPELNGFITETKLTESGYRVEASLPIKDVRKNGDVMSVTIKVIVKNAANDGNGGNYSSEVLEVPVEMFRER